VPAKAKPARRTAQTDAPKPASRREFVRPPIVLRGVRTHNLKDVSCDIPSGKLTVITGVSGSGKSSLAFDTVFAEGQRRFVESLSTYARQFLDRMPRPDADLVENIPPAIALEQKNTVRNARSTVGTATEINDYLRLLFGKAGQVICPDCKVPASATSPEEAGRRVLAEFGEGARLLILAPVPVTDAAQRKALIPALMRDGHTRVLIDGELQEIDAPDFKLPAKLKMLPVLIDRVIVKAESPGRLTAAVDSAYNLGNGRVLLRTTEGLERTFARAFSCPECGTIFKQPDPRYLNFNNPLGACESCQGFGRVTGIDWGKVIPNQSVSIAEGCIAPWNGEVGREMYDHFDEFNGKLFSIPRHIPYSQLSTEHQDILKFGQGKWPGVKGFFKWLEGKRYKVQARITLARFRAYTPCPECEGARVAPAGRALRFGGVGFGDLCAMSVRDLVEWFDKLVLSPGDAQAVERPLSAVRSRLKYLDEVGLGYLTLARATRTLSGGEAQRINLATALGGALTDTLYVLDEPTVGLHASDTARLINILRRLVDAGNTVVVVEHDPEVMLAADHLIDIGPGAGETGGNIIYSGPPSEVASAGDESATARFLSQEKSHTRTRGKDAPGRRHGRREPSRWITIEGAHENNLRHVTARVPLGVLCCVTGVSGSGKSTLIKNCLYGTFRREEGDTDVDAGEVLALHGLEQVVDMVLIDQSPPARSTRSNAATFLKAYEHIRTLFASTRDAEMRGLTPREFSFNVKGGRCETCEGTGRQTIEMLFLADVEVLCETCDGARFQDKVLNIRWNGKSITDVLEMTVAQAITFFAGQRKILEGLQPLADVGLGYLRLGQNTSTISGGEAQRMKIAAHLADAERAGPTLLLFDEPTTGLHPADIEVLLGVFQRLIERGFSLVVIEHNIELIRQADYVLDLGPGGGDHGGNIVVSGTPEDVAACDASITGHFLKSSARRSTAK
jgi:excinuclease ABC subunit A